MTCKDVSGMLDRLIDGELTADERRELEAHGRECPDCADDEWRELLPGEKLELLGYDTRMITRREYY